MPFDNEKLACLKRKDNSNKGSIDPGIRKLVDLLNSWDGYYTTSSCSGRIMIIELIEKKKDTNFVFVEHKRANFKRIKESLNKLSKNKFWFKQESLILHVCCRNLESAEKLLSIVRDSGIKRAGIISLTGRIIIEIIGTEHIETLIAKDRNLLVDDAFLKALVEEANIKMEKNNKRIKVLCHNLERL